MRAAFGYKCWYGGRLNLVRYASDTVAKLRALRDRGETVEIDSLERASEKNAFIKFRDREFISIVGAGNAQFRSFATE